MVCASIINPNFNKYLTLKFITMKKTIYIFLGIVLAGLVSAGTYILVKSSNNSEIERKAIENRNHPTPVAATAETETNKSLKQNNNINNNMNNTAAKPAARTSESVAKQKNVPALLENPGGDYSLVAVVEGKEANSKLNQSLQIVSAQRANLAQIYQQFERTPEASIQQRELIAGKINEARRALEQNLRFMAANYAYTLNNNYVLIPHEATLNIVEKDGEASKVGKEVYAFADSESYSEFVSLRDAYLRLKLEHYNSNNQKAADSDDLAKDAESAAKPAEKLKPSKEMTASQKELKTKFGYDPEDNYQISFTKAALYARAAR